MPFYVYECSSCNKEFEVMQGIHAQPLQECELCHSQTVRRKIFAPNMLFKGDGFYTTEYRSGEYRESEKKENPDSLAKKDGESAQTSSSSPPQTAATSAPSKETPAGK